MRFFILIIFLIFDCCLLQAQINVLDSLGKKQGKWLITGKMRNDTIYFPNQLVEEGNYYDNRKVGPWKEYHLNGNLKSELIYESGKVNGRAIIYYENGCVKEEGTWKNNRWVGKWKEYNEKGEFLREYDFKSTKREGKVYYCTKL